MWLPCIHRATGRRQYFFFQYYLLHNHFKMIKHDRMFLSWSSTKVDQKNLVFMETRMTKTNMPKPLKFVELHSKSGPLSSLIKWCLYGHYLSYSRNHGFKINIYKKFNILLVWPTKCHRALKFQDLKFSNGIMFGSNSRMRFSTKANSLKMFWKRKANSWNFGV